MNADSGNGAIVPRKHIPVLDRCFHTLRDSQYSTAICCLIIVTCMNPGLYSTYTNGAKLIFCYMINEPFLIPLGIVIQFAARIYRKLIELFFCSGNWIDFCTREMFTADGSTVRYG
jgi:hypothetical protein